MNEITWDTSTLYDKPSVGTCELSDAYETGRFYKKDGKRPVQSSVYSAR